MQETLGENYTLGDFIRHVAAVLTKENNGFPYSDDTSWHKMLLDIRNEYPGLEPFKSVTFVFDDSTYPTCTKMSEFLEALHWSGALSVENPAYKTAKVKSDLADMWEKELNEQSPQYRKIVEEGVKKLIEYSKSDK
ncbi:MAG: hypothetical protein QXP36_07305 [Conexivisphaerales archaeon]